MMQRVWRLHAAVPTALVIAPVRFPVQAEETTGDQSRGNASSPTNLPIAIGAPRKSKSSV
jgi:hypothetical protein